MSTVETYKSVVKMTFLKGASFTDPSRLFNSNLQGNARRAIDPHEGDASDEKALKASSAAVTLNRSSARGSHPRLVSGEASKRNSARSTRTSPWALRSRRPRR